jgi:diguanylate cyclase (GGDEF)-like protein
MILRQTRDNAARRKTGMIAQDRDKPLALFTESMMSVLTSRTASSACVELVSLMGQTFPLSAPALYMSVQGMEPQVYSVLDAREGGDVDARRMIGETRCAYTRVLAGGNAPYLPSRVDIPLIASPSARVVLSINPGGHEGIFREWVKYLTPAIAKLLDNELLMNMAFRDGLTGLLNYRAFSEILLTEWERSRRYRTVFSLMMIDIDHFKRINDEHGHPAGDLVLKAMASGLQGRVRKSDLVFRYGGEEFMVMLPETKLSKARLLAERIRGYVEKMRLPAAIPLTVSIGISQYRDGLMPADLVEQADTGLYCAKDRGRNRVEAYEGV